MRWLFAAGGVVIAVAVSAGVAVAAEPGKVRAGKTSTVVVPEGASATIARCTPPGEFHPNATKWTVNPSSVTLSGPPGMPVPGVTTVTVTVPHDLSPFQTITVSWTGNSKCASFNGWFTLKVLSPGDLGGPNAKIGARQYSPFEKALKFLILDDYECLKAYSDTCTTEQAYELALWYVLSIPLAELGGKFVLKPIWAAVGPELRALLEKYGPKIAEGSKVALAEFRDQLARLIPTAITRLPPDVRLKALDSLMPVLKEMPVEVQQQLVKMRATEILKPGGKYIGSYDTSTKILTVKDTDTMTNVYKQLKLGGDPAGKAYPGQLTNLPGGGTVGLKNKPTIPKANSPNSVGPSVDINIPGFNVEKIKPATHAK